MTRKRKDKSTKNFFHENKIRQGGVLTFGKTRSDQPDQPDMGLQVKKKKNKNK